MLFIVFGELGEIRRLETEGQNIHTIGFLHAVARGIEFAEITFGLFLTAVDISAYTEIEFEVIGPGVILFVMINQYPGIIYIPLRLPSVTPDGIVHRAGYIPVNLQQ